MKDKALAVLREAWVTLRWTLYIVCIVAYVLVWLVWVAGGPLLLQDLGVLQAFPTSYVFVAIATVVVMVVGLKSYDRDLREFLRL